MADLRAAALGTLLAEPRRTSWSAPALAAPFSRAARIAGASAQSLDDLVRFEAEVREVWARPRNVSQSSLERTGLPGFTLASMLAPDGSIRLFVTPAPGPFSAKGCAVSDLLSLLKAEGDRFSASRGRAPEPSTTLESSAVRDLTNTGQRIY